MRNRLRLLGVLLIGMPTALFAQAPQPVNPTGIEFTASPDHAVKVDTIEVVTGYEFQTVNFANQTAVIFTSQLGKPTPDAQGKIRATISQFQSLPNGVYGGKVAAVGPGGTTFTPVSSPFGRVGPPAPAGALVIVKTP